jgi:hypothetical protein
VASSRGETVGKYVGGILGATIMLGLLGRLGSESSLIALAATSAFALLFAWLGFRKLFTRETALAIRRWHVGQLGIFWIAAFLSSAALLGAMAITPRSTVRYVDEICPRNECPLGSNMFLGGTADKPEHWHTITVPEPHPSGDTFSIVLVVLAACVVPISGLVVTWIWFGGRSSQLTPAK